MPKENAEVVVPTTGQDMDSTPVINENVIAHIMQIVGSQSYQPTQAQVDKMLAMQEKGMDYTFKERNTFTADRITKLIVLVVFVGIYVFSVYTVPQYVGEIISGMIGFLTGGIGGYGYAQSRRKSLKEDD